jgi:hypothetical protein
MSGSAVEAVALAEQTCQASGYQHRRLMDTLAAAYAAAGQYNKAAAVAHKALSPAESAKLPDLAEAVRGRLRLYEKAEPFRDSRLR